jgi:RHH-type proline utilization regulon transcriptional repressor/proline dehydrogenase/delta 1-pyrroline-5-carboxylate dehydrogenase
MASRGFKVHSLPLPEETASGSFVPPTLIEITELADVEREVFGPVLHVLRYRRSELSTLIEAVNATGYGLTFGLHTRIDETIAAVTGSIRAGNIYVNRNMIGAVVGVQPFGGNGLSGTGPKAGGPLYLQRLGRGDPAASSRQVGTATNTLVAYLDWLQESGRSAAATRGHRYRALAPSMQPLELPGPVGERNEYRLRPRGRLLIRAETETGFHAAIAAALATGNRPVLPAGAPLGRDALPTSLQAVIFGESEPDAPIAAVLFEGGGDALIRLQIELAAQDGPIIPVHAVSPEGLAAGREDFPLAMLVEEVSISTNTAAAGGNASLMTIG